MNLLTLNKPQIATKKSVECLVDIYHKYPPNIVSKILSFYAAISQSIIRSIIESKRKREAILSYGYTFDCGINLYDKIWEEITSDIQRNMGFSFIEHCLCGEEFSKEEECEFCEDVEFFIKQKIQKEIHYATFDLSIYCASFQRRIKSLVESCSELIYRKDQMNANNEYYLKCCIMDEVIKNIKEAAISVIFLKDASLRPSIYFYCVNYILSECVKKNSQC